MTWVRSTGSARHQGPRSPSEEYPAQAAWDTQGWLPPCSSMEGPWGKRPLERRLRDTQAAPTRPQTGQHSALGFTSHTHSPEVIRNPGHVLLEDSRSRPVYMPAHLC